MSYRPYVKTSNGIDDVNIDAETLKGHAVEETGIASNTTTIPTTAQVKAYVDANAGSGGSSVNIEDCSTWNSKTWTGLTNPNAAYIWNDGNNIYYSNGSSQYVLNKETSTWSSKSWSGYTSPTATYIWTDGDNIYYSNGASQYVLNKENSRWSSKTWSGIAKPTATYIWTDGNNIYYSNASSQYVLNKETSTWNSKTWSGLTNPNAAYIWTDGDNIYHSNDGNNYVLNKETSTWSNKTWSGLNKISANYIWTDGDNIYYSNYINSKNYVLNKETSTWSNKTWSSPGGLEGTRIWTDGDNIYYSSGTNQFVLNKNIYKTDKLAKVSATGNYKDLDGRILINESKTAEQGSFNLTSLSIDNKYYTIAAGSVKSLNTSNSSALTPTTETISGSGEIKLHRISKTASWYDLLNRPTVSEYPKILSGDFKVTIAGKNNSGSFEHVTELGSLIFYSEASSYTDITSRLPYSNSDQSMYYDSEDGYVYIETGSDLAEVYSYLYDNENSGQYRFLIGLYSNTVDGYKTLGICELNLYCPEGYATKIWETKSKCLFTYGPAGSSNGISASRLYDTSNSKYVSEVYIIWDIREYNNITLCCLPTIYEFEVHYMDGTMRLTDNPLTIVFDHIRYDSTDYPSKTISPFDAICINEFDKMASCYVGDDD